MSARDIQLSKATDTAALVEWARNAFDTPASCNTCLDGVVYSGIERHLNSISLFLFSLCLQALSA